MQTTTKRMSASSIATEPSASSCFLVFSPNRWLISRASSPTSSVSRTTLVSGEKYPSYILPDPAIDCLLGFAQRQGRLRASVSVDLPPLVVPFRGERYAAQHRLSALIAPPYDVIAPAQRADYAARDSHNIVHLILPEAPADADRYAGAAERLAAWRSAGVLQADPGDAVYVVAQDYGLPSGERRARVGMFAAVRAEPFATRRVRPHEQTHAAPKADRLALLRATRTSLESIFLLAP